MALMFLLDTNIFLEILLQQEKSAACKAFIQKYLEHIYISDLHLDFDDAYQYLLARQFDFTLVTLDKDFKHLTDINIQQP
jgi:predicted nucleic acid-binding protein